MTLIATLETLRAVPAERMLLSAVPGGGPTHLITFARGDGEITTTSVGGGGVGLIGAERLGATVAARTRPTLVDMAGLAVSTACAAARGLNSPTEHDTAEHTGQCLDSGRWVLHDGVGPCACVLAVVAETGGHDAGESGR